MKKLYLNLNWVFIVFLILLVFGCQTVEVRVQSEPNNDLERYDRAADIIYKEYVDTVPVQKLIVWSIDGVQAGSGSRSFIEDENDPSLSGQNLSGYHLNSSHDIEDVKSNFRTLFSHSSRNLPGFSSLDFVDSAIQGMIAHLDPQCALLSPDDLQRVRTNTKGKFAGIGIVIAMKDGFVTVMFSMEGTPAHRVGIVAGDRIHRVNGHNVDNVEDALRETRGFLGEKVTLTITGKGKKTPVDYEIFREVIPNKSVYTRMLRSGFGYAWIGSFDENTAQALERALAGMDVENRPLRGLILDSRDNLGGLLSQAIEVSDLFLEKGDIVSVKGRIRRNTQEFKARPNAVRRSYPIVVLINEGSASAAEIVASALQENHRAIVLGKTSFGKGSIQAVEAIGGGYGIKITIARYHTPEGNPIQGRGVVPDVFISDMLAGRLRKLISAESGLTDDPVIDIALLAMESAKSSDFYDLLAAARRVVEEKKIGLGVDDDSPLKSEKSERKQLI